MANIKKLSIAAGVIGEYDTRWEIIRCNDAKTREQWHELYINAPNESIHYGTFECVKDALGALIKQFE